MIAGEEIKLIVKTQTGLDPFGAPVYTEAEETISDVCVGNPTAEQVLQDMQLHGKRLAFVLGIPKGDTHEWKDVDVLIRGERFRSYGPPLTQTEANVPGRWNTQVKVERFE